MVGKALKRRLREIWHKLSRLDATPDQIAIGFCIGIVASLLPLNPSPGITAIAVAWLLKRNVVAAGTGAVTAMLYVPLLPVIWLAEYRVGSLILPVRHSFTLDQARLWNVLQQGWDVYAAMLIGSSVIAMPVTLFTYLVVRRLAERWARRKKE